jgi:hypothetical protein
MFKKFLERFNLKQLELNYLIDLLKTELKTDKKRV